MYSQRTVERNITKLADAGIRLRRYDIADTLQRKDDLASLVAEDGSFKRALSSDERAFIANEQRMCAIDFLYWFERYCSLLADQGGLVVGADPWESQLILLRAIANLEDKMYDAVARGEPVDGILIFLHKARQLGATLVGRAISTHAMCARKHARVLAAAAEDEQVLELYVRDKRIIDNLPFYLRPSIGFDEKAQHIFLDRLGSHVIYQSSRMKGGMGQGRQFDVTHATECSSWLNAAFDIERQWMPTIPQSVHALALLESTAQRRHDWWHAQIKRLEQHRLRRWNLVFIPYYVEERKYRATPPVDWRPNEESMAHAQRVYETSERYTGHKVMLSREKLYWWQTTREEYYVSNNLADFYTSYCATVEESFQNSVKGMFTYEMIEYYRQRVFDGISYRIDTVKVA